MQVEQTFTKEAEDRANMRFPVLLISRTNGDNESVVLFLSEEDGIRMTQPSVPGWFPDFRPETGWINPKSIAHWDVFTGKVSYFN